MRDHTIFPSDDELGTWPRWGRAVYWISFVVPYVAVRGLAMLAGGSFR